MTMTVEDVSLADFTDRLLRLAQDAAKVGNHGKAIGDGRLVLQAIQQERDLITTLLDRLGIDSAEIAENQRQAGLLARAVASAARAGQLTDAAAIGDVLRDGGAHELAIAIESIATTNRNEE